MLFLVSLFGQQVKQVCESYEPAYTKFEKQKKSGFCKNSIKKKTDFLNLYTFIL